MQGYVALHRKLMDSWVGEDPMALALWVRMLLEATHKPRRKAHKGTFYNLSKGQFLFGLGRWSEKTGIPREVIRKRMDLFESDGMITRQKHPHTSIVTVVKWDSYQRDNTLTTEKEHPNNTQTTRKQQEYNNVNNEDNGNNKDFSAFDNAVTQWNEFANEVGLPTVNKITTNRGRKIDTAYKNYKKLRNELNEGNPKPSKIFTKVEFVEALIQVCKDGITDFHINMPITFDYLLDKKRVDTITETGIFK